MLIEFAASLENKERAAQFKTKVETELLKVKTSFSPVFLWLVIQTCSDVVQTSLQDSWLHLHSIVMKDVRMLMSALVLFNYSCLGNTVAQSTLHELKKKAPDVIKPFFVFTTKVAEAFTSVEQYMNAVDMSTLVLTKRCTNFLPSTQRIVFPIASSLSFLQSHAPQHTFHSSNIVVLESGVQRRNLLTNDITALDHNVIHMSLASAFAVGWYEHHQIKLQAWDISWQTPRCISIEIDPEWSILEMQVPNIALLSFFLIGCRIANPSIASSMMLPMQAHFQKPANTYYLLLKHVDIKKLWSIFSKAFQIKQKVQTWADLFTTKWTMMFGFSAAWAAELHISNISMYPQTEVQQAFFESFAQHSNNMQLLKQTVLKYSNYTNQLYPWPNEMDVRWSFRTWDDYFTTTFGQDVVLPSKTAEKRIASEQDLQTVRIAFEKAFCIQNPQNFLSISTVKMTEMIPWFTQEQMQIASIFSAVSLQTQQHPLVWKDGTVGKGSYTVAMLIRGIGNEKGIAKFPQPLVGRYRLCMSNNRRMTAPQCRSIRTFPNMCSIDHYHAALHRLLMCCQKDWNFPFVPALYNTTVFAPKQKLNFVLQFLEYIPEKKVFQDDRMKNEMRSVLGYGLLFSAVMARIHYRHNDLHGNNMLLSRLSKHVKRTIAIELADRSWLVFEFETPFEARMIDFDRATVSPFVETHEIVPVNSELWKKSFPSAEPLPLKQFPPFHAPCTDQTIAAFYEGAFQSNRQIEKRLSMLHLIDELTHFLTNNPTSSFQMSQDLDSIEMCDVTGTFVPLLCSILSVTNPSFELFKQFQTMLFWSLQCTNSTAALFWNAHLLNMNPHFTNNPPSHAWMIPFQPGRSFLSALSTQNIHSLSRIDYSR